MTMYHNPVILVLDQSMLAAKVISLMIQRQLPLDVTTVMFTNAGLAASWLSGAMDKEKARRSPLSTPWDKYPAHTQGVDIAIIDSDFPLQRASLLTGIPIVTLFSERPTEARVWDSVAYITKPVEDTELIVCLSALLASESPTMMEIPAVVPGRTLRPVRWQRVEDVIGGPVF